MRAVRIPCLAFVLMLLAPLAARSQAAGADVHAQLLIAKSSEHHRTAASAIWLKPIQDTPAAPFVSSEPYTLLQKNRTFKPHLLVVPVGTVVRFPNADPFFHNVFSLFDGKRFDLGLYEAGSTKSVTFSREGVSYIFCNIHPEMSAVILTLTTPLYSVADGSEMANIQNVPPGTYSLHVWIEGLMQPALDRMTRRVQVRAGTANTFVLDATDAPPNSVRHLNKFGQPYDPQEPPPY